MPRTTRNFHLIECRNCDARWTNDYRAEAAAGRGEYTLSSWLLSSAGFSEDLAASLSCRLNSSMIDCDHLSDHKSLRRKYCSMNEIGSCARYFADDCSASSFADVLL